MFPAATQDDNTAVISGAKGHSDASVNLVRSIGDTLTPVPFEVMNTRVPPMGYCSFFTVRGACRLLLMRGSLPAGVTLGFFCFFGEKLKILKSTSAVSSSAGVSCAAGVSCVS